MRAFLKPRALAELGSDFMDSVVPMLPGLGGARAFAGEAASELVGAPVEESAFFNAEDAPTPTTSSDLVACCLTGNGAAEFLLKPFSSCQNALGKFGHFVMFASMNAAAFVAPSLVSRKHRITS